MLLFTNRKVGDGMADKWVTMTQACLIYGVSRRTLTRWINQGKVESKIDNKRRLILASDVGHGETKQGHNDSDMTQEMSQQAWVEQLRSEIARLEHQLETKDKQIEREQMISMQLSRDIAEQKDRILALESSEMQRKRRDWWSRIWKRTPEA